MSSVQIEQAQHWLFELGLYLSAIDGRMTAATQRAIDEFLQRSGIAISQTVTAQQFEELVEELKTHTQVAREQWIKRIRDELKLTDSDILAIHKMLAAYAANPQPVLRSVERGSRVGRIVIAFEERRGLGRGYGICNNAELMVESSRASIVACRDHEGNWGIRLRGQQDLGMET